MKSFIEAKAEELKEAKAESEPTSSRSEGAEDIIHESGGGDGAVSSSERNS